MPHLSSMNRGTRGRTPRSGRQRLAATLALLIAGALACGGGGDSPTEPPPPPPLVATSMAAASATTVTGTVAQIVTERPSVIVRSQNGNAMGGVPVTFTVTAGGGSVTDATVTTTAAGSATVGSWTLGTTAGANTLTASAGSLPVVTFTATGTAAAPSSITKATGDNQSGTAGSDISTAPAVTIKDAHGNLVSGATVTFAVVSGGGSVTGGTQATNAAGIATVGSWKLGTSVGGNTLSATVGSLSAVTFTATANAGAAATLTKSAGDNQAVIAGDPVSTAPSVTVRDAHGNAVGGVTVTFAPAANSGTVTGGTQTSSATGAATVGQWRLGSVGTSTLTVSAPGVSVATFTATSQDPCQFGYGMTIGTTYTWDLHSLDCLLSNGRRADSWLVTLAAGAYVFEQQSTAFNVFLQLYTNTNPVKFIAVSGASDSGKRTTSVKALVSAGNYFLSPQNYTVGELGSYTVSTKTTSESNGSCELVYTMPGVTTVQSIATTDCSQAGPYYSDTYWLYLAAGSTTTFSMSSTSVNSYLILIDINGTERGRNDNKAAGTVDAQIVFTPSATGWYRIEASTASTNTTGTYTLSIQ